MSPPLILASASPRRRELLERLAIPFQVVPADTDETVQPGEAARAYVARVAALKASQVASRRPGGLVLAADTSVVLEDEILGKPANEAEARSTLARLAGRTHVVLTAVALAGAGQGSVVCQTQVHLRQASSQELAWYVSTGEPMDKAGSYAIQGIGGFLVQEIHGSHSNVIGLPLAETLLLLSQSGWTAPWSTP